MAKWAATVSCDRMFREKHTGHSCYSGQTVRGVRCVHKKARLSPCFSRVFVSSLRSGQSARGGGCYHADDRGAPEDSSPDLGSKCRGTRVLVVVIAADANRFAAPVT